MPLPFLPDEARLLFLASRPDAVASETYLAALVASRPNWGAVGRLAEREKLLPVLWAHLREHAELVPEAVKKAFQRQAAVTEFRMAATETTLQALLLELEAIGVRVMLLKGAALAATVYGSWTKRPMGDLDILVPAGDAERAWRHVRGLGWKLEYENGDDFYGTFHHLPALVDPSPLKVVLEVHRSMLPFGGPFALTEEELWRDARRVHCGQSKAWVPSDLHMLLHLSVHFAWSHMFGGIGRTVRDVATIVAAHPIDWSAFTALAIRTRASTAAFWTLTITHTLTGTPVPAEVLAALRPRGPDQFLRALERSYISTGLFSACPSIRAANFLWTLGIQPGASGHGAPRPWHANDRFGAVFKVGRRWGIVERSKGQVRGLSRWWRFGQLLMSPRRML